MSRRFISSAVFSIPTALVALGALFIVFGAAAAVEMGSLAGSGRSSHFDAASSTSAPLALFALLAHGFSAFLSPAVAGRVVAVLFVGVAAATAAYAVGGVFAGTTAKAAAFLGAAAILANFTPDALHLELLSEVTSLWLLVGALGRWTSHRMSSLGAISVAAVAAFIGASSGSSAVALVMLAAAGLLFLALDLRPNDIVNARALWPRVRLFALIVLASACAGSIWWGAQLAQVSPAAATSAVETATGGMWARPESIARLLIFAAASGALLLEISGAARVLLLALLVAIGLASTLGNNSVAAVLAGAAAPHCQAGITALLVLSFSWFVSALAGPVRRSAPDATRRYGRAATLAVVVVGFALPLAQLAALRSSAAQAVAPAPAAAPQQQATALQAHVYSAAVVAANPPADTAAFVAADQEKQQPICTTSSIQSLIARNADFGFTQVLDGCNLVALTTPAQSAVLVSARAYPGNKAVVRGKADRNDQESLRESKLYAFMSGATTWFASDSTLVFAKTGSSAWNIEGFVKDGVPISDIVGIAWDDGWGGFVTHPLTYPLTIPAHRQVIMQINHLMTGDFTINSAQGSSVISVEQPNEPHAFSGFRYILLHAIFFDVTSPDEYAATVDTLLHHALTVRLDGAPLQHAGASGSIYQTGLLSAGRHVLTVETKAGDDVSQIHVTAVHAALSELPLHVLSQAPSHLTFAADGGKEFLLVFNRHFDSNWKLYPGRPNFLTALFPPAALFPHFEAGDQENAWFVSTQPSTDAPIFTLYYWPQSIASVADVVTFLTFAFFLVATLRMRFKQGRNASGQDMGFSTT